MNSTFIKSLLVSAQHIEPYDITTGILACFFGLFLSYFLLKKIQRSSSTSLIKSFVLICKNIIPPLFTALLLFSSVAVWDELGKHPPFTFFCLQIISSWFFIALVFLLINRKFAGWIVAVAVIPLATLNLFSIWGHGKDLIYALKHIDFRIGIASFTLYDFLIAIAFVVVLTRFSKLLTNFSQTRISASRDKNTSNRLLMIKTVQFLLYFIIALIVFKLLGINTTTLTVFGGAIGVGLGFGLQKVTSNFISGIIMLLEKSTEIGDMVELTDGTTGIVKQSSARYTLVETFQGKEVLVPNEDFIIQKVVNWTHSHHRIRVEITLGISYTSDLALAKKLMIDAALENPECLKDPEPTCYLREFDPSAVKFLLLFWIGDVMKGSYEPQSEIMLSIWRKFKENGIEIAYPQLDITMKNN